MCEHKHLKSVNCVLYCMDCGAQLPAEYNAPKPKKTAKKGAKSK